MDPRVSQSRDEVASVSEAPEISAIDRLLARIRKELEDAVEEYSESGTPAPVRPATSGIGGSGKSTIIGEWEAEGASHASKERARNAASHQAGETPRGGFQPPGDLDEESILLALLNQQLIEANEAVQATIREVDLALKRIDAL